jgi:hypothetical protein
MMSITLIRSPQYFERWRAILRYVANSYGIKTDSVWIKKVDEDALKERVLYKSTATRLTPIDRKLIATCIEV